MPDKILPPNLYKTTIVIWSEVPTHDMELTDIAREAESGSFYCSRQTMGYVDPRTDSDFGGTEFFGVDE